jgi:hypothetical protein
MVAEEDSLVLLVLLLILGVRWRAVATGRRGDHHDGGGEQCGGEKTTERGQRRPAMAAILVDPLSRETPSRVE